MRPQRDVHISSSQPAGRGRSARSRRLQALLVALAIISSGLGITAAPAQAASVNSASFTGENGKSSVRDGVLYAKTGLGPEAGCCHRQHDPLRGGDGRPCG